MPKEAKLFCFFAPALARAPPRTLGADNATSCGAFLCDVGLVASGRQRLGAQDVCARETKTKTTKRKGDGCITRTASEIMRRAPGLSGENGVMVRHTKKLRSLKKRVIMTSECRRQPPRTHPTVLLLRGGRRPRPWTLPRLLPGGPSVALRHVILAHAAEPPGAARLQNNEQRPKYISRDPPPLFFFMCNFEIPKGRRCFPISRWLFVVGFHLRWSLLSNGCSLPKKKLGSKLKASYQRHWIHLCAFSGVWGFCSVLSD